ncbi:MAG: hypothetical protein ACYCRH_08390 [Acidiferrobacteraceae bacterium]
MTFGYNGGQWNIGTYTGFWEGLSFSLDPRNSGCHKVGFKDQLKAQGLMGFGPNIAANADIGYKSSSAELSLHIPETPLHVDVGEANGKRRVMNPTFGYGESGFVGAGRTVYLR